MLLRLKWPFVTAAALGSLSWYCWSGSLGFQGYLLGTCSSVGLAFVAKYWLLPSLGEELVSRLGWVRTEVDS